MSNASLSRPRTLTPLFGALALGLALGTPALAQDTPQLNLTRVKLAAGMHQIDAQVAQTPAQRQTGLMFRREMPQHEGMLFVFEQPATQCFWMKNTLLPLTAAFVADDGTIVNLADMKPQTEDSHCSTKPVRYVLEGAYTRFLGSQTEVGVDRMASVGAGIEFDSSAYDIWATRWRALLRYKFGPDIAGWSVGLAVSF